MQRTVYQCDVCKTEQQQANHWLSLIWLYRKSGNVLSIGPLGTLPGPATIHEGVHYHLCGDACVIRKVNEYLGALTAPRPQETERDES